MKRFIAIITLLCILSVSIACTKDGNDIGDPTSEPTQNTANNSDDATAAQTTTAEQTHWTRDPKYTTGEVMAQFAPEYFYSIEEYEEYAKDSDIPEDNVYYIPDSLDDSFTFDRITLRVPGAGMYPHITFSYKVAGYVSDSKLDSYENERKSSLLCQYSLGEKGEVALERYIEEGYEPTEIEGNQVYVKYEHEDNDQSKDVLAYNFAMLIENHLIYIHLPATDSYDNMLKYAIPTKCEVN